MDTLHGASVGSSRPVSIPQRARRTRPVAAWILAALALAGALPGCGEQDSGSGVHELGASRVYEPVGKPIRWNASAAERHGVSASDFARGGAGSGMGGGMPGAMPGAMPDSGAMGGAGTTPSLHWTAPPGWKERPAAMFRDANFYVAGNERAECYLTTLGGEAGGMEANINRWRTQVSLPPLGSAEVAALPRVPWLGGEAVAVDFAGHWKGMAGDQAEEGWRLVGLLLVTPEQSRFLKMVGPQDVIGANLDAFHALADSFHEAAGDSPHAAGLPPAGMPELPPDHPTLGGGKAAGAAAAGGASGAAGVAGGAAGAPLLAGGNGVESNASLAWHAPAGWQRGPEKQMREVTYFAGEGGKAECYVTLLAGTGGGLLANINRWCTQMGAPALTDGDVATLEHVPMAGADGVLVRLDRGPAATAAPGADLMLGAVCLLSERALFVKMTGPRDAVDGQRAALIEFCKSLKAR